MSTYYWWEHEEQKRTATKYVIVHENMWDVVAKYSGVFVVTGGLITLGWLIGTPTVGIVLACICALVCLDPLSISPDRYEANSIEDARRILDALDEEDEG